MITLLIGVLVGFLFRQYAIESLQRRSPQWSSRASKAMLGVVMIGLGVYITNTKPAIVWLGLVVQWIGIIYIMRFPYASQPRIAQ